MKKFTALFLFFSLVMLSANLYAKERRGAKLIITKKNGYQTEGELITVKPSSLLLLNNEGKDVSIDIADIKVIRVVKKSKFWKGAVTGALIGGVSGVLLVVKEAEPVWENGNIFLYALGGLIFGSIGALIGTLIGGIVGAAVITDDTIQIEGMSDLEIREALDKLRKKARIRDYK